MNTENQTEGQTTPQEGEEGKAKIFKIVELASELGWAIALEVADNKDAMVRGLVIGTPDYIADLSRGGVKEVEVWGHEEVFEQDGSLKEEPGRTTVEE